MDYEKKYKEALERAKEMIKDMTNIGGVAKVDDIQYLFPELKESEEERMVKFIKKQLFNIKKTITENYELDAKLTKAIDWIEKQGEQKPTDVRTTGYWHVEDIEHKPAWSEEDEAIYYGVIETEQYMLDVVNGIKKFDVGNISIKEECTRELNWLISLKDKVQPQPKQEWSEEEEKMLSEIILDLTLAQINDSGKAGKAVYQKEIDWLKSLKES